MMRYLVLLLPFWTTGFLLFCGSAAATTLLDATEDQEYNHLRLRQQGQPSQAQIQLRPTTTTFTVSSGRSSILRSLRTSLLSDGVVLHPTPRRQLKEKREKFKRFRTRNRKQVKTATSLNTGKRNACKASKSTKSGKQDKGVAACRDDKSGGGVDGGDSSGEEEDGGGVGSTPQPTPTSSPISSPPPSFAPAVTTTPPPTSERSLSSPPTSERSISSEPTTQRPTRPPLALPTKRPTRSPLPAPTKRPTRSPLPAPTKCPTRSPLPAPTKEPTEDPTGQPTLSPEGEGGTPLPSPTRPTEDPTGRPTLSPEGEVGTPLPSPSRPTEDPMGQPTLSPDGGTLLPSPSRPTEDPTGQPTTSPDGASGGEEGTEAPTQIPTEEGTTPKPSEERTPVPREVGLRCTKKLTLPTGAVLTVEMDLTDIDILLPSQIILRRHLQEEEFQIGSVDITEGREATRFAHFTYVVDISGSTTASCGNPASPQDNVLDCEIQAIANLNTRIAEAEVAVDVGLVQFDGTADIMDVGSAAGFQELTAPEDPGVNAAIRGLQVGGNTNFRNALRKAIELIEKSQENPKVLESFIVFVTDGDDRGYNSSAEIAKLQELRTKVFAFAVGSDSVCSRSLRRLATETGGGDCIKVVKPSDLQRVIADVLVERRTIESVKLTVDNVQVSIARTEPEIPVITGLPPRDSPAAVFATLSALALASSANADLYQVCLAGSSRSDIAQCCVNVTQTVEI